MHSGGCTRPRESPGPPPPARPPTRASAATTPSRSDSGCASAAFRAPAAADCAAGTGAGSDGSRRSPRYTSEHEYDHERCTRTTSYNASNEVTSCSRAAGVHEQHEAGGTRRRRHRRGRECLSIKCVRARGRLDGTPERSGRQPVGVKRAHAGERHEHFRLQSDRLLWLANGVRSARARRRVE